MATVVGLSVILKVYLLVVGWFMVVEWVWALSKVGCRREEVCCELLTCTALMGVSFVIVGTALCVCCRSKGVFCERLTMLAYVGLLLVSAGSVGLACVWDG